MYLPAGKSCMTNWPDRDISCPAGRSCVSDWPGLGTSCPAGSSCTSSLVARSWHQLPCWEVMHEQSTVQGFASAARVSTVSQGLPV